MSNIDNAYNLYKKHIYDDEKVKLLKKYNLKVAGSVPSVMWELFGAHLTGKLGAGTTGADLAGWEVKSAKFKGSYEYQYHLNTGAEKLEEDCIVNHLFCTYSETYTDVIVRAIAGRILAPKYFKIWKPEYFKNYDSKVPASERRQRFRRSIAHRYVEENGELVLEIKDTKLVARNDNIFNELK